MRGYDVVIDGSDTSGRGFSWPIVVGLKGSALVSASAVGFQDKLLVVVPDTGKPMLSVPHPRAVAGAKDCNMRKMSGFLGGIVGIMGSLAAVETVKLFLAHDPDSAHRFLAYDGLRCRFITAERVRTLTAHYAANCRLIPMLWRTIQLAGYEPRSGAISKRPGTRTIHDARGKCRIASIA